MICMILPEPLEYYPAVERCAWDLPVFYTLLRRGINWAKEEVFERINNLCQNKTLP